jgi:hypothetical protein
MEQLVNEIRVGYADRIVNELLAAPRPTLDAGYIRRFTQGEEFFLELTKPFTVPKLPIHHDVRQSVPRADYINGIRDWVGSCLAAAPNFFSDLTYFFDPGEVLKPCFYRLYRVGDDYYLYLLRIDLSFRPMESDLIERGSNDQTASFSSRRLYMESDFIPLSSVLSELGKVISFVVKQTVSQTWIGETGKGYLIRGIWMDAELSKFFSKLFLPAGRRSYPYYPFTCRYKTLCLTVLDPLSESRRALLPYLHRALAFLVPEMEAIQQSLKAVAFNETLPKFQELKAKVPEQLLKPWAGVEIRAYLNTNDQKEFAVEF